METQIYTPSTKTDFSAFSRVWFGQVVSLLGSGLTSFALGVWAYQTTKEVTDYALIALFTVLPTLLLSLISGALVDRWNYRIVMLVSDAASALTTLFIASLYYFGRLEIWHIYVAVAANASFAAFQQPAYAALTSKLVPSGQMGRAAGMMQVGLAVSELLPPLLAGVLIMQIGLTGVILIDFGTFLFAVAMLMLVKIPLQSGTNRTREGKSWNVSELFNETRIGWKYIAARPGLLGLLAYFMIANFASGIINSILVPLLLTITIPSVLGLIISIAGGGMLTGSLVVSAWGGPKRRIQGVLNFEFIKGLGIILIGLRPEIWLVALGATLAHFAIPFAAASNQAIWQEKIPQEIQGRIFAIRQMVARSMMPLAFLVAGPLADHVFEPLMKSPRGLFAVIGTITGIGAGRGMGLLFSLMGLVIIAAVITGMFTPVIRNVEDDI
jgi:MFS family permease